jgi:hypothetical protein
MSIYNLQEAQAPFLMLQGSNGLQRWDEGALLSYRLQTTTLQVSANTLQLYAYQKLHFGPSWRYFDCSATTTALCVSRDSAVVLFGTQPVTTPRDVTALLSRSELLQAFNGVVCSSDSTGRSLGDGDMYTVSMCDLVEGALRFVIEDTGHGARVHWIRDGTGVGETLVLCVIALYAASVLAQHLSELMAKKPSVPALKAGEAPSAAPETTSEARVQTMKTRLRACALNVLACVVFTSVLLGMCETHREFFVSHQDVDLYHVLVLYLGAEVVLLCLKETRSRDSSTNFGHQIGLSTTVLLLATLRLHNTFNTPFLLILVGLFGTRTVCKTLQHIHDGLALRAKPINLVSVLFDLGAWCALLAYSTAQCSAVEEYLAIAVNVVIALLLGLAMCVSIAGKSR